MDNVTAMSAEIPNPPKGECIGLVGPMEKAWQQSFPKGLPNLTIIWHEGWLHRSDKKNYWRDLHDKLMACSKGAKILVVLFDESPACPDKNQNGNPLGVLLRAIAEGATPELGTADRQVGWASVSEIDQFASRVVEWKPVKLDGGDSLLRLCDVCAALLEKNERELIVTKKCLETGASVTIKTPLPELEEFFEFLEEPMIYRAKKLHAAGEDAESAKRGLRLLKWLETRVFVPNTIPLNVLLVENDPDKLRGKMEVALGGALIFGGKVPSDLFSDAKVYLLRHKPDFDRLISADKRKGLQAEIWNLTSAIPKTDLPREDIPWDQLDLILQDLVLDNNEARLHGLELVAHYFEACPQALVFLLTSLDVESLVGSGDVNWRYSDAIISKDATETLTYEYRRCFRERFGRMFWPDWCRKIDETERKLLRGLFGSLRKWQIEPDILWHGQSLPEMIDHANRHITALWRLTNNFVGTLLENGGANDKVLSLRHRVSLAVAVWMHDVGHRGDEYIAGSMEIRASHAGISERLLLRNPKAYGLEWLLDEAFMPYASCCDADDTTKARDARLACRNETHCAQGAGTSLCLLREAGLLCRHHQSNAPLDHAALAHMAGRGKEPSVYSLMPKRTMKAEDYLADMTNDSRPVPSPSGNLVRKLDEFKTQTGFRCVMGLLRMLDALQLHRSRVGSAASLASFNEFLDTRFQWCHSERLRLDKALRTATPGTTAFLRTMSDLSALEEYELLLNVQYVHFWRQAVAHEAEVKWSWQPGGIGVLNVAFTLNERALAELKNMTPKLPRMDGTRSEHPIKDLLAEHDDAFAEIADPELNSAAKRWAKNVYDEVAKEEHESQYGKGVAQPNASDRPKGYLGTLKGAITFRVTVSGTDQKTWIDPVVLLRTFNKTA